MAKSANAEAMTSEQEEVAVREPVTATGLDLLKLISAAPGGFLYLLASEGQAIVQSGQAVADFSKKDGDAVAVFLTPAGKAAVAAQPSLSIRTDIPVPTKKRAGRKSVKYPIDSLEVGQSFHVPLTVDNQSPAESIQSTISNARAKFAVPAVDDKGQPIMETVTVKNYQKDANGKIVKDAEGHRVVASTETVTRQKMVITRDFIVATVGGTDPDGPGARVWRSR